ncbi:hypothetical protein ACGFIF_28425 [Kribbella sp. NPDC049174]|uniref:hypothetical protein n=1 Tax=Kribbella sp. NPDC049174 TaxID=3364112 RepID=UPI0037112DCE
MTDFFDEINGHRVVDLSRVTPQGRAVVVPVCLGCGAHFTDRREIEGTSCPVAGEAHGHDLVTDAETGLLVCSRCPLVAYDLADAETEPTCPMPLRSPIGQWPR